MGIDEDRGLVAVRLASEGCVVCAVARDHLPFLATGTEVKGLQSGIGPVTLVLVRTFDRVEAQQVSEYLTPAEARRLLLG